MGMTNEQIDNFYDLLHSRDPQRFEKAKDLADEMGLKDDPEFKELIEDAYEELFGEEYLYDLVAREFSSERFVEFEGIAHWGWDNSTVDIEFDFKTDHVISERDGISWGKQLGADLLKLIRKELGFNAKIGGVWYEITDSHDHDGIRPIMGKEWGVIKININFPTRQMFN